jgi:tripartite-type tricarboxylate transporter receptor subunit TctC
MVRTALVAALSLSLAASGAAAQANYPDQPIRILVGFTPGVAPDITGRLLADKFAPARRPPPSTPVSLIR